VRKRRFEVKLERMLTTEEVAGLLRMSREAVWAMRHRGTGPRGVRVGKRVLYPESEVVAWLQALHDRQPA
jgi:excisionase family DNA binding protein